MTSAAVILGMSFFVTCIVFVAIHASHVGCLTLLDWALLSMGGMFGAGWALVASVTSQGGNPLWEGWLLPFEHLYPLYTAAALILAGATSMGWVAIGALGSARRSPVFPSSSPPDSRLIFSMWVLFVTSFVMQWLYTLAYGGFVGLLEYSPFIRAGIFPIQNSLSFLQPFGGLTFFASFGFFGLWLSRYRSVAVATGLVLSFLFSIYVLFSLLGRISFMIYLATFVLGGLSSRRSRPLALMAAGGAVMIFVVVGAYYTSLWLNLKPADSFLAFLAHELVFPFVSFFAQIDSGEHLSRAFRDYLVAPVFLLPSSLWYQWIEDVSQVNTAVIMGAPKGVQGVTGGIPVDLITLGLMQASITGVALAGVIFGGLLRMVQALVDRIPNPGVRAVLGSYIALKIAMLGVFYAQPSLVVSGNFDLLVSLVVIGVILKLPRSLWRATLQ